MDLNQSSYLKQLTCQKHRRQIEFIYLKDDHKPKLACSICSIEYQLDYQYILIIEQLFQQKDETIFKSLPPGLTPELYLLLDNHNIQLSNRDALIEEISKEFKKYGEAILTTLEQHKKLIINDINSAEEKRSTVIQNYNQISSKQDLQKKIIEFSNNPSSLDQYLKDMISAKNSSSLQDKQKLEDSIKEHQNLSQKINLEHIQNSLLNILEKVKSADFLYTSPQPNNSDINTLIPRQQPLFAQSEYSNPNYQQISPAPQNVNAEQINLNQIPELISNQNNENNTFIFQYLQPSSTQIQYPNHIPQQIQQPSQNFIEDTIEINSISQLQSIINISSYLNILIDLEDKSIVDNDMSQLSACLKGCKSVNQLELNLHLNSISNKGIIQLCQTLEQMTQLNKLILYLGYNKDICEIGYSELSKTLLSSQSRTKITHLKFGLAANENVTDSVVETSIIPILLGYTHLSTLGLYLWGTMITNKSVRQIANKLKYLTNLNTLELSFMNNNIQDDECFQQLSETIVCLNSSLNDVRLNLQNNQIGEKTALSLVNALSTCSQLIRLKLYLNNNHIREQCKKQIVEIEEKIKNGYCKKLKEITIFLW